MCRSVRLRNPGAWMLVSDSSGGGVSQVSRALGTGLFLGAIAGAVMGGVETADVLWRTREALGSAGAGLVLGLQIFAATLTAGALLGAILGLAAWLLPRVLRFEGDLFDFGERFYQKLLASLKRDLYFCAALAALAAGALSLSLYVLSRGFLTFPLGPADLLLYATGVVALVLLGCLGRLALGPRAGGPGRVPLSASGWAVALLGVGIFALLYVIDRDFYVRLYNRLHLIIATVAFLALIEALVSIRSAWAARSPAPRRALAVFLALLWGASGACALAGFHRSAEVKALLFNRTTYAKRIYPLLAQGIPVLRPRSPGPAEAVSRAPEASAVRPSSAKPGGAFRGASLVLITIDALRADRVGVMGGTRETTPHLDRFAKSALLFPNVHAQGSNTFPSIASLMTGRLPSVLDWTQGVGPPLDESNVLLAEVLREAGYDTGAVTPHRYFGAEWGLAQGFNHHDNTVGIYNKDNRGIVSRRIPPKVRSIIPKLAPPFFLWVHFYDPHAHYMPRPENRFGDRDADLYDGEVLDTDAYLGELIDWLDKNIAGDALFVVTSDHGEEFGEHGGQFHGTTLYEEVTRVPLLIRTPDRRRGVVKDAVSLLDLAPTLLDVLGIKAPPALSGRSLAPALTGESLPEPPPPVFSEATQLASKIMVLEDGWKLIHDRDNGTWELYDLGNDPGEMRNLYDREPERAGRLRELLLHGPRTGAAL